MEKIYVNENYIIWENSAGEEKGQYACAFSVYTLKSGYYRVKESIEEGEMVIKISDIGNYGDQSGTPYTESSFLEFLRKNTGNFSQGGGSPSEVGQFLYMELNSVQNMNVISPFVDLDFVEVTNDIPGATVSSAFPIGSETYKGVVTLPPGVYQSSGGIATSTTDPSNKNVVANISRYAPSVIFYPESTNYLYTDSGAFTSLQFTEGNYPFFNVSGTQSFGIISARAGGEGVVNTIPEQSFWKIQKIG